MPDQFCATGGKWVCRKTAPNPDNTEWLYSVNINVLVGLTCPPDDPDILIALWQNALERMNLQDEDDPDLIDSFELIEVTEASDA